MSEINCYSDMLRSLFGEERNTPEVQYMGASQEVKEAYEEKIRPYREMAKGLRGLSDEQEEDKNEPDPEDKTNQFVKALLDKGKAENHVKELQQKIEKITTDNENQITSIHNQYVDDKEMSKEDASMLAEYTKYLLDVLNDRI